MLSSQPTTYHKTQKDNIPITIFSREHQHKPVLFILVTFLDQIRKTMQVDDPPKPIVQLHFLETRQEDEAGRFIVLMGLRIDFIVAWVDLYDMFLARDLDEAGQSFLLGLVVEVEFHYLHLFRSQFEIIAAKLSQFVVFE